MVKPMLEITSRPILHVQKPFFKKKKSFDSHPSKFYEWISEAYNAEQSFH